MCVIWPPEISGTWMHQGTSRVPSPAGLYWPNAGEPLAVTGTIREPSQPPPQPVYQPRSSSRPRIHISNGASEGRRRGAAGVRGRRRREPVEVVTLERVHVAGQQVPVRILELRGRPVVTLVA